MRYFSTALFLMSVVVGGVLLAAEPAVFVLSDKWYGVENVAGQPGVSLKLPGTATYAYPVGRGWYAHGFRRFYDQAGDWREYRYLEFSVFNADGDALEITVKVSSPPEIDGNQTVISSCQARANVSAKGWNKICLPLAQFDNPQANTITFKYVQKLEIAVKSRNAKTAQVRLGEVKLLRGKQIYVTAVNDSAVVASGKTAQYTLQVGNVTAEVQNVIMQREYRGWEAMTVAIEPAEFSLQPGEVKDVVVRVKVPESIPAGGSEMQTVIAIPNGSGDNMVKTEFVTGAAIGNPYLLHTVEGWNAVREKIRNHEWARLAAAKYLEKADKWQVPEVKIDTKGGDTGEPFLFNTPEEYNFMAAAIAWQVTRKPEYAQKVVTFLRRLEDPKTGYPRTLQGCNQSLVQEGHFFQHIATAADLIEDSGLLSVTDRENLATTMRLYMETIDQGLLSGGISNWVISELHGAFFCALYLGDLKKAFFYLETPGGLNDNFSIGCMADGWWYECSISYNTWVASEYSQIALALEPWGINYKDKWFAPGYLPGYKIGPRGPIPDATIKKMHYGKSMEKWGKIYKPYVRIKDMWDALLPFLDSDGVMFGVNDSTEMKLSGDRYELAYYLYRDPRYIAIINNNKERDLIYGVPVLPATDYKLGKETVAADNVGVMMLRSQTPDRKTEDQINAVLKYGTHGGYHGHFDRTALNTLMRYGRSFFNPEMVWYSYPNFMYAFYVQTSIAKNMVTVDRKQQDPQDSTRLLFYAGRKFQAGAAETVAKWSEAPYGGLTYNGCAYFVGKPDLYGKTLWEKRYLPIPADAPKYGDLTGFTDPVRQRRLMIVTDDYVVVSDYAVSQEKHLYECLFQIKGFRDLQAPVKKFLRHDDQWSDSPLSSAQFVTDCNIYEVEGVAKASFLTKFGPDADNRGTRINGKPGNLYLDVYSVWPQKKQVLLGTVPELHNVARKLDYQVMGDGKVLNDGSFGAWILGHNEIDVPLKGVDKLELRTSVDPANKSVRTIFWADAVITTADVKKIKLAELKPVMTNVLVPAKTGLDFTGGPVKIAGREFKAVVSGEPQDFKKEALITVDLHGLNAVRFASSIGGDYPLGNEAERRKTLAFAEPAKTTEARFLTVIEAYDKVPVVSSVIASGPDRLTVKLTDGREQRITIVNFAEVGKPVTVKLVEYKDGKIVTEEITPVDK